MMPRHMELRRRSRLRNAGYAGSGALAAGFPAWSKMIEGKEVVASAGAVASEPEDTVRIGAQILESGGNAMDAAAAMALACGMLQPELCGIGGYVLCGVVLEGASGRVWSLDANSVAPAAAPERLFEVLPPTCAPGGAHALGCGSAVRERA